MPRIIRPSTKAAAGALLQLELHAPGLAHDADLEILVALEDRSRVVGLTARIQHRERAAPVKRVQPATRGVEQAVHLLLREVLEASGRRDPGVDGVRALGGGDRQVDLFHHGRISIGVPTDVRSQISTMSELLTAMHPSVQSLLA